MYVSHHYQLSDFFFLILTITSSPSPLPRPEDNTRSSGPAVVFVCRFVLVLGMEPGPHTYQVVVSQEKSMQLTIAPGF
jgi:hypothetical protein